MERWRRRSLMVFLLVAACGTKSPLSVERAIQTDAATDGIDAMAPDALEGTWVFNTVRAVCDTFAFTLCDDGRARARFSYDDTCRGELPSTVEPYDATIAFIGDDLIELRLTSSPPRIEPLSPRREDPQGVILRFLPSSGSSSEDRLEVVEWIGLMAGVGFWDAGTRRIMDLEDPSFASCDR